MVTKDELMKWMKTYKKEHCKSISTMKKDELYKEAVSHGFLHEKHGLKKKTKTPTKPETETKTDINSAFPKTKTQAKPSPVITNKITKEQIDTMAKEIEKIREKAGRIAEREGKMTKEVKKLLESVNKKTKERMDLRRAYTLQQKA